METPKEKPSWQEIAQGVQKTRDDSIARIDPPIPSLPTALPNRVVDIPRQLLSSSEVSITETSAEDLVVCLAAGELTATAVARAFLRRAAIAQKLVSKESGFPVNYTQSLLMSSAIYRPIVSMNSSPSALLPRQNDWTITCSNMEHQQGRCTAYLSVSKHT
ncbi:unnamed protein product [Aspergillus oryzae]|uniref:Unnamed protein product n=1 Tax=Aspergillus oryzae var. brunneus TaxID=332754 RepID=A0ABQ6KYX7_ASPOZ|nr:unnamed protein product [Aspergillus oryzae]GMF94189.1 unnamed protein product [Aspergillus oryzae]GMG47825.1 unnamed protein product [Aspergillus oryzae var. brunneus]